MDEEPRWIVILVCGAPKGTFDENEEAIPEIAKKVIQHQGGLPCDGGGVPGEWCIRCAFSVWGDGQEDDGFLPILPDIPEWTEQGLRLT